MDYVVLVHNRLLHPWSLLSLVHIKVRDAIRRIKNVFYGNDQQIEEISIRLHQILYTHRVHHVSLTIKTKANVEYFSKKLPRFPVMLGISSRKTLVLYL